MLDPQILCEKEQSIYYKYIIIMVSYTIKNLRTPFRFASESSFPQAVDTIGARAIGDQLLPESLEILIIIPFNHRLSSPPKLAFNRETEARNEANATTFTL